MSLNRRQVVVRSMPSWGRPTRSPAGPWAARVETARDRGLVRRIAGARPARSTGPLVLLEAEQAAADGEDGGAHREPERPVGEHEAGGPGHEGVLLGGRPVPGRLLHGREAEGVEHGSQASRLHVAREDARQHVAEEQEHATDEVGHPPTGERCQRQEEAGREQHVGQDVDDVGGQVPEQVRRAELLGVHAGHPRSQEQADADAREHREVHEHGADVAAGQPGPLVQGRREGPAGEYRRRSPGIRRGRRGAAVTSTANSPSCGISSISNVGPVDGHLAVAAPDARRGVPRRGRRTPPSSAGRARTSPASTARSRRDCRRSAARSGSPRAGCSCSGDLFEGGEVDVLEVGLWPPRKPSGGSSASTRTAVRPSTRRVESTWWRGAELVPARSCRWCVARRVPGVRRLARGGLGLGEDPARLDDRHPGAELGHVGDDVGGEDDPPRLPRARRAGSGSGTALPPDRGPAGRPRRR